MALESAQYIHQLEASNPAGSDQLAQGDEHLRMIKATLKATFPNITAPVTKTAAELNATGFSMPVGIISAWYGSSGSIPAGWALCNGATVPLSDGTGNIVTPDLRDRTVVGAGSIAAQGVAVGSATSSTDTGNAGSHVHTIGGGNHTHGIEVQDTQVTGSISTTTVRIENEQQQATVLTGATFNPGPAHRHTATAAETPHSHTISTEGNHAHSVQVSTIQPSLGLHWIMKI